MALGHTELVRELRVPSTIKVILYALSSRADDNGYCWPSIRRLCHDTGLARRTIQLHLGRLVRRGAVEREVRQGRASRLRLNLKFLRDGPWSDAEPETPARGGQPAQQGCTFYTPRAHVAHLPAHHVHSPCAGGAPKVKEEEPRNLPEKTGNVGAAVDNLATCVNGREQPWWKSVASVRLMAIELGISAHPGEDYWQYKDRVFRIWRVRQEAARRRRHRSV